MIAALGLWIGSRLLLSASAVASLVVGIVWSVDFGSRLLSGEHLLGVTAYMWDSQYPLFTRSLSLYHLAWPVLMLACLSRIGYDRRGWTVQAAIAVPLVVAGRFAGGAAENINYAFSDPLWQLELGPPAVHLATIAAATAFVVYGASHRMLALRFGRSPTRRMDRQ